MRYHCLVVVHVAGAVRRMSVRRMSVRGLDLCGLLRRVPCAGCPCAGCCELAQIDFDEEVRCLSL